MENNVSDYGFHNEESDLEIDEEQGAAAITEPSTRGLISSASLTHTTSGNSIGVYNNSHHAKVRRSTDDREQDLFLEEDRSEHPQINCNWYSDGQAEQPSSLGSCEELSSSPGTYPDEHEQSLVEAFGHLSLQCPVTPQQECETGLNSGDSLYNGVVDGKNSRKGSQNVGRFLEHSQPIHESRIRCHICLFKRGIIARDELEHALYIFPLDQLLKVLPRIKKNEALVHHGTEFPLGEEHQTMNKCSLHRRFVVTDYLHVRFEVVGGQFFSIVSPTETTVLLSEISSKSEERIAPGFSLKILVKCTGETDEVYEDQIRVKLQSGNAILHLMFPIAYYEASVSPWLYDSVSVIPMPEEDRAVLRSCHVALLDNIGDVLSLCEYLYQHKIIDSDDMDEIQNIIKKRERNAFVLRTLQTRGNILDFVIKVMQGQRENQGAAAILQKMRYQAAQQPL